MAKILYGVCGEGLGHTSRSRILVNHLKKQNHEVRIVAGGKAYDLLSKEFDHVYKSEWPMVIYKNNKVQIVHTLLRFIHRTIVGTTKNFFVIRKVIGEFKPDLLITDSEPISFYAAFFSKIKRLSIDNPQVLLYRKYKVKFREIPAWLFLCFVLKISLFNADKYIIYDYSDEQINDPKILFLKPLIQEVILKQKPTYGNHVFVYQTSASNKYLFELLKKIDEKFIIYGMNKNLTDKNLVCKKFNEKEFYQDISGAKAIITNGGFTVISEALYLKKPIFCLPIHHQFEQILNGRFVEGLSAGVSYLEFDENKIKDFLKNLKKYKENLKAYNPGNQQETLKTIEEEIKRPLAK
jgi:uncharacterized protein (TIGR00661 family)